MKKSISIFCLICLMSGIIFAQMDLYVNNVTGNNGYNGLSPIVGGIGIGPKQTISNAIITSVPGSTIFIAATGVPYIESPNVDRVLNFIGYSEGSTPEYVNIILTGGDMTFNIPAAGTIYFMVLPIGGTGYSYAAAAGFKFKGTATTGFYFQSGQVVQVNTNFLINFPFRYK